MDSTRVFSSYAGKWEKICTKKLIEDRELLAEKIEKGIILPLIKNEDSTAHNGVFQGGVCDSDLHFISGLIRDINNIDNGNYHCNGGYIPDKAIDFKDETVVFGGILFGHFGHVINDGLSRLWYFVDHKKEKNKYIFLVIPGQHFEAEVFLESLGLSKKQYDIIEKPTQYREIIVPEQAAHSLSCANKKWVCIFDEISKNINIKYKSLAGSFPSKIYLTRSQYKKKDGVNEECFETFFRANGFEVISPELLPIEEQILLISNAKELVCTIGTLSHLALFMNSGSRVVCLLRNPSDVVIPQILINQVRNIDYYFVESTFNILPTSHVNGIYLYGWTKWLLDFLDYDGYDIDGMSPQIPWDCIEDYLRIWSNHYKGKRNYKLIGKKTLADLVDTINYSLEGQHVNTKNLNDFSAQFSQNNFEANYYCLKEKYGRLEKKYGEIVNSRSWKLTRPLRAASKLLKIIIKRVKSFFTGKVIDVFKTN